MEEMNNDPKIGPAGVRRSLSVHFFEGFIYMRTAALRVCSSQLTSIPLLILKLCDRGPKPMNQLYSDGYSIAVSEEPISELTEKRQVEVRFSPRKQAGEVRTNQ